MADHIAKYYQGTNLATPERVRLLRLAWDLVGTQFGSRQTLYQHYFNGDVVQQRMRRYAQYDYSRPEEPVRWFLAGIRGCVTNPLSLWERVRVRAHPYLNRNEPCLFRP